MFSTVWGDSEDGDVDADIVLIMVDDGLDDSAGVNVAVIVVEGVLVVSAAV